MSDLIEDIRRRLSNAKRDKIMTGHNWTAPTWDDVIVLLNEIDERQEGDDERSANCALQR